MVKALLLAAIVSLTILAACIPYQEPPIMREEQTIFDSPHLEIISAAANKQENYVESSFTNNMGFAVKIGSSILAHREETCETVTISTSSGRTLLEGEEIEDKESFKVRWDCDLSMYTEGEEFIGRAEFDYQETTTGSLKRAYGDFRANIN
jgi:hypothetical protein